ncbi:MAG TPA: hypothetical protein VKK81_19835 [Candidatus Binatia bacterium]|nr:hypothetical protein [Candidatus Binatia bacterium]
MNAHLNREKEYLDSWRDSIVRLRIVQSYCTVVAVAGSVLIAALAPNVSADVDPWSRRLLTTAHP